MRPDTAAFAPPARPDSGRPDLSELFVTIEPVAYDSIAPAELLLTEPGGKRVGADPASWRGLVEVPHASYDSTSPPTQTDGDPEPGGLHKVLYLVTPPPGHYVLQVLGRKSGTYKLTVKLITPRAVSREARVTGSIRAGEVKVHRFTHDDRTGPLSLR